MKQDTLLFGLTMAISAIAITACGGDVTTSTSTSGAGGSGGESGSTGTPGSTGSAAGTGGSAAGAGGSGGAGGGMVKMCGGFAGLTCEDTEWCDFPDDMCGGADGLGSCLPRPIGCDDDCPGVCGCDGNFYCNACNAQSVGLDVSALISCAPESAEYSAGAYFGGYDHVMFRKADKVRDVCVTLHMLRPSDNSPGFAFTTPMEWGVGNASISDQAADCDGKFQPVGNLVNATGGMGTISFNIPPGGYFPCDVSVHGTLSFPPGEPWVLTTEPLDADMVVVKDGCL